MASSGGNATLTFNSVTIDDTTTGCIQSWSLADSESKITYLCGGTRKATPGVRETVLTMTVAIDKDDTGTAAAFDTQSGTIADFDFALSSSAGHMKWTSSDSRCYRRDLTGSGDSLLTYDIEIHLNQVTRTTVST